jgi:hypothetical protein
MSKTLHVVTIWSRIAIALMLGTTAALAQSSPIVFQGLPHTAVGAATLRLDTARQALEVSGLGPDAADGVAVRREDATSWTAHVSAPIVSGIPLQVSWSAIADGRRIGSGLLQQRGARFEMSGVFTGATLKPTFSAQVYQDGLLVGSLGSLPPTAHVVVPIDICRLVPEFCEFTTEFHTLFDGACMVKIVGSRAVPILLPNGAVMTGNEVRLVEEVRPGGHYPYLGFDTLVMRSDAPSFDILSETLR